MDPLGGHTQADKGLKKAFFAWQEIHFLCLGNSHLHQVQINIEITLNLFQGRINRKLLQTVNIS